MTSLLPSIPAPKLFTAIFSHFPLRTYPVPESELSNSPLVPTLWLLGPPGASGGAATESLDPISRQTQCYARFKGRQLDVKWCKDALGAVGGKLPCLHLPNGELLGSEHVDEWIEHPERFVDGAIKVDVRPGTPNEKDTAQSAFTALLRSTLLPAVLASLYLSPPATSKALSVVPAIVDQPFLSSIASYFAAIETRRETIALVKKFRGGRAGPNAVLDLEEVEREGVETIGNLEDKVRAEGTPGWFAGNEYVSPAALLPLHSSRCSLLLLVSTGLGAELTISSVARSATALDALIYSLLSIIVLLPLTGDSPLRLKVEKSPSLMAWLKRRAPSS